MNTQASPFAEHGSMADAVERVAASVAGLALRRGAAAAVAWKPGLLVSVASAVWRAQRVAVVLPDGEQVEGRVVGCDAGTDLAAIAVDGAKLPAVARAEGGPVRTGDFVFAVGREPSGLVQASFGHVGAAAGEWRSWRGGRIDRLIRLDGGLYPGLAGAPVADSRGALIGIASAAFSRHHGVVIPAATVERVLDALQTHGRVPQGYLGVAAQPVRAQLDGAAVEGLLVSSVAEGGPAAAAGLLVGDVIIAAGGQPVRGIEDLRVLLAGPAGSRLTLRVARGGHAVELGVDVAERPGSRCH